MRVSSTVYWKPSSVIFGYAEKSFESHHWQTFQPEAGLEPTWKPIGVFLFTVSPLLCKSSYEEKSSKTK